jgi:histidinol dehydrogenase
MPSNKLFREPAQNDQNHRKELIVGARRFLSLSPKRSVVFDSALLVTFPTFIEDVRRRGDEALVEYAARFDKVISIFQSCEFPPRHFGRLLKR